MDVAETGVAEKEKEVRLSIALEPGFAGRSRAEKVYNVK